MSEGTLELTEKVKRQITTLKKERQIILSPRLPTHGMRGENQIYRGKVRATASRKLQGKYNSGTEQCVGTVRREYRQGHRACNDYVT